MIDQLIDIKIGCEPICSRSGLKTFTMTWRQLWCYCDLFLSNLKPFYSMITSA